MASQEGTSLISVDFVPTDDTGSLCAASKSSIGQGSSARSSGTSLALHDMPGVEEPPKGSIGANGSMSKTMMQHTSEIKTDGSTNEIENSDEDKSQEGHEPHLQEKDDPHGLEAKWDGRYPASRTLAIRRQKAALRLDQSKAYAQLVEDRILELEKKVRELRNEKLPRATSKFPFNFVGIEYQNWAQFSIEQVQLNITDPQSWSHRPEIDLEPRTIIEVLLEAPSTSRSNTAKNHIFSNKQVTETAILNQTDIEGMEYPHLIRIRSRLLLKTIKEVTGCRTVVGPYRHRLLFLRPYKLFVKHAKDLRDFLNQLEKNDTANAEKVEDAEKTEHGNSAKLLDSNKGAEMNGDPPSGDFKTVGPIPETHSEQARKELRVLITMIDNHLSHQISLQYNLIREAGKVHTVKFADLWHIFKPGYEIRSHDSAQIQLYRIIRVSGGRDATGYLDDRLNEKLLLASKKLKDVGYSTGSFLIEALYIGFDGTRFGPVNVTFQIRRFEGDKDIVNLPVYPLVYDPKREQTKETLIKRGKTFAELSKPKANAHRKYKGLTLDPRRQEHVESEVIIDSQLAFTAAEFEKPVISSSLEGLLDDDPREFDISFMNSTQPGRPCIGVGCCGNDIVHEDYEIDKEERTSFQQRYNALLDSFEDPESLTNDHKALLPPQVYGFVLRTRKWATFDIDLLEPPDYDDGWDNLVIDTKIKDMVLALVDNHERPHGSRSAIDGALSSVDLVQGKGRGLIILLHGEPGVGKTSTAECVASHTKRPLFPVTCGDIGEKAPDVEDHLEKNFQLAHKWGCVLLLDEADVFLAKRGTNDIQRNAIVSVFLRTLEYYSGILFLTTNRVGKIDRAFKSRIHLSLFYPKLDEKSTLLIWKNNLNRVVRDVEAKGMTIDYREKLILDFAKEHFQKLEKGGESKRDSRGKKIKRAKKVDLRVWNGRQIRNAFQTAIAIARYEARDKDKNSSHSDESLHLILSDAQFRKVASIAEQFDEYLNDLYGKNEADLAKKDKMWADNEDVRGGKECRRQSRDRDRSESRGRERRAKRKRYDSPDDSEESEESDESDYRSKKATNSGRRRSRF